MNAPQYPNTCPRCGAAPGKQCRTLRTGRATDTHRRRIDEAYLIPREG